MRVEDIIKTWHDAKENNAERLSHNCQQMYDYLTKLPPDTMGKFMIDMIELFGPDFYNMYEKDQLQQYTIFLVTIFHQHREAIQHILNCPEMDLKYV